MKCKAQNKQGMPCNAKPMNNGYCFRHNPETKEQAINASVKGGSVKWNELNLPNLKITNIKAIPKALIQVINEIRTGLIPCKEANSIGYLINILKGAYELSDITKRLEAIEERINNENPV